MSAPAPSTVALRDGRVLAYDDVGDPDGSVVVYLHGAPDCRLARHPDDSVAADLGLRLLAIDRPGYGRSSPPTDPSFEGCAPDVGELLAALGVARCRLLAWSAGGPRALAAAAVLGERCEGVTLYGAMPPVEAGHDEHALSGMPRRAEVVRAALDGELGVEEIASEISQLMLPVVPVPAELARDLVEESLGNRSLAELRSVPGMLEALAASQVEAAAVHGRAGVVADMHAEFTPGHAEAVLAARCPVRLVYGDKDAVAGPPVGDWYAERLADAVVEVWDGGTHHSLFPRWAELLR